MTTINNRYDFVLVFDVKDGNPNGDPDAGNLPRVDPENGQGLVTDVCLKRKVRNYVQMLKPGDPGYEIYVREKSVLGAAHFRAFKELGIETGKEGRIAISEELQELFDSNEMPDLPEGLQIEGGELVVTATADIKTIDKWSKDPVVPKEIQKVVQEVKKKASPRKPTSEEKEKGRVQMCRMYYDIRTFGAVLSLKTAPNCGQVRGPVQFTFGRSVDPIVTLEHSITRMAVATEAEAEKQSGDNRTMGRKNTVPYGIYVSHGFVSPCLAAQTGFSDADLELLWDALVNMFEQDHSAARGEMTTLKLVIFKHDSALGNAPSRSLFKRVKVQQKANTDSVPARSDDDYEILIDRENLPSGVTIIEKP